MGLRTLAVACALGLTLSGCALFSKPADTVSFQRGQAWQTYSDMRVTYSALKLKIEQACKTGKLDAETCAPLPRIHEEMLRIDKRVMGALANPAVEVDWAAVAEAIGVIVKLAGMVM